MKLSKIIGMGCVISLLGGTVQAAPPASLAEAIAQINADSTLLTGWISQQFKHAVPFNSTAGNVVPSQLKFLGFSVGAAIVVSGTKLDNDGLHNLGTNLVNTNEVDTFDRAPFPMILGHAKIGLPMGFDLGMRLGGIPNKSTDKGDTRIEVANTVIGFDLRKSLLDEGMTRPFGLTLGLNFTKAKGHILGTTQYTVNTGNSVILTDAVGTSRTDWDTKSVGAQLIANKQILFMNPYIGVSANKNFGRIDSSISNTGTLTYTGPGGGSQSLTGTGGTSSAKPNSIDLRGLAGLEFTFLPFMKLGIGGEIASENNLAGHIGLRVQFR